MASPVLTLAQMRSWETASWAAGIHERELIETVGQRVGQWLLARTQLDDRILFLTGAGHNGDDARAAAQWLGWRRRHRVLRVTDPATQSAEVHRALAAGVEWVVDAWFGIGLNREFSEPWRRLLEDFNEMTRQHPCRVVAMDVPSGLRDDAGHHAGAIVRADFTLTVGAVKRGLVGLEAAGRVEVLRDVGLLPGHCASSHAELEASVRLHWLDADDFTNFPPARPISGHKGTFGHLLIVAGSVGYHGAAVLAAQAALRAGPGLVTVLTDPGVYGPIAAQLAQPMVHPWSAQWCMPNSVSAVVLGPGLASRELPPGLVQLALHLWQEFPGPVLADANALPWVVAAPARPGLPRVVTPHPGEAAGLLGRTSDLIQSDRVGSALGLRERFGLGSIAVLKGFQTLIAGPGGLWINPTGNAELAQGGAGDVLSGFLGGLLARRLPVEKCVCFGVWEHGAAADRLARQHRHWTVDDLQIELGVRNGN